MKSPRFLAALAMAAVLTTGTAAHAAAADFNPVSGNVVTGQTPMQQSQKENTQQPNGALPQPLTSSGEISLDGTFTKTINNFPTPTVDGHYLRVTMPIKMDYTYDVDNSKLTSSDIVIVNDSAYVSNATASNGKPVDYDYKKIKVSLLDFEKNNQGTTTMGQNVKFVKNAQAAANDISNKDNILLPFELRVSSPAGHINEFSIETIQDKSVSNGNGIAPITIEKNSSLTLKLEQINGQSIGNKDLIKDRTSKISHNLKLRFEYDGN